MNSADRVRESETTRGNLPAVSFRRWSKLPETEGDGDDADNDQKVH